MGFRRVRIAMITRVGQWVFIIGLLLSFLLMGDIDNGATFAIVGVALALVGAAVAIYGDLKTDYPKAIEMMQAGDEVNYQNIFFALAGSAFGLGVIGIIFIAVEGAWGDTVWVALEIGSIGIAIIFGVIAILLHKKRQQHLQSLVAKEPTIIIDVESNN
jgi:hypothetical protein